MKLETSLKLPSVVGHVIWGDKNGLVGLQIETAKTSTFVSDATV